MPQIDPYYYSKEALSQQKLYPYDGSQDSTRHPLLINPKDIIDSDNIIYTTYSTKKRRPGISQAFLERIAGNNHILGQVDFWRNGIQYLVFWDGRRLYSANSLGQVDDITGAYNLPTDEAISFVKFAGLLIIFFQDNITTPKKWTTVGPITELGLNIPAAPFGRVWNNQLFIPDPTIPGRLLNSVTDDPTDFSGAGSGATDIDVNDGDPDGITAIFPEYYGSLYIAKRFSIWKISPVILQAATPILPPLIYYSLSKVTDGVGCNSHNAVVATEANIIWPDDRGFHNFVNTNKILGVDIDFLSKDIQPVWVDETNFSRAKYMQAVYDVNLNSYICIFPPVGQNFPTDVWGYSVAVNKWYRWRNYNQTSIARYVDFKDKKRETIVGSTSGDIGIMDLNKKTDYGKPFSLSFQSGIIAPMGTPDDRFAFYYMAPIFVPQITGEFKISYKIDGQVIDTLTYSMVSNLTGDLLGENFVLGQSVLGGVPQVKLDKRRMGGNGMFYSIAIEHTPNDSTAEDEGFEMLGILVDFDRMSKSTGEVSA